MRTGHQSLLPIFKCIANEIKNDRLKLIEKIIEFQQIINDNERDKENNKKGYCLEIDMKKENKYDNFVNDNNDSVRLDRTVSLLENNEKKITLGPYSQSTYSVNSVRSRSPSVITRKGATYVHNNTTSDSYPSADTTSYDNMNCSNSNYNSSINNRNNNNSNNNNDNNNIQLNRRGVPTNSNSNYYTHSNSNLILNSNNSKQQWQT